MQGPIAQALSARLGQPSQHPLVSQGFSPNIVEPFGNNSLGIMIVGEAPGEQEDDSGQPFAPWAPAGSVLAAAIRRAGCRREQFVITNVVPARPPKNWLEGAPWEAEAISWGLEHLDEAVRVYKPRAIVALGSIASRVTTGLSGSKLGVSHLSGYAIPSPRYSIPVIPCFHPSFLRRGAMALLGVMVNALRKAKKVAAGQIICVEPPVDSPPEGYILHPDPSVAESFLRDAKEAKYISFDIETPYSTDEESAEEVEEEHRIKSIQFSLAQSSGIFMPWRDDFIPIAKEILALPRPKLGWNIWHFDNPVLYEHSCKIAGEQHDLIWAWHHLQPDLPRGLQFAAGQLGWPYPWKHLSGSDQEFYGIVDVEVLQWMVA